MIYFFWEEGVRYVFHLNHYLSNTEKVFQIKFILCSIDISNLSTDRYVYVLPIENQNSISRILLVIYIYKYNYHKLIYMCGKFLHSETSLIGYVEIHGKNAYIILYGAYLAAV